MITNTSRNKKSKKPSFFRVLSLINVLILIVSFTLVGLLFTSYSQSQSKAIFLVNAQSKIEQNEVLIEYISDTVVNLSRQVFRNQKFNRLISTQFNTEMPRYEARTEAVKILEPQQQAFKYIDSLVFIGKNGFNIGAPVNQFLNVSEKEFIDEAIVDLAWASKSEYLWVAPQTHPVYSPDKPVISVLKSFQNFITLENSGVLIINLNPDIFTVAVNKLRIGDSGFMILADKDGRIIAEPDLSDMSLPEGLVEHVITATLKEAETLTGQQLLDFDNFETVYNNKPFFINFSRLEQTNWYSIAIIEKSAFTKGNMRLLQYLVVIILVAILASVTVSLKFSHWLFKPILHLSKTMKAYESGEYTIRISETYKYEFEVLRENFNHMADRIDHNFSKINTQMDTIRAYSTDLEKSKIELNNLNQDLEARVDARTKELSETNTYLEQSLAQNQETQAELIITKSDLEDSLIELKETQGKLIETEKNAALGQLLAGISHEINTPLGTALTTVTYLQNMQSELEKLYIENNLSRTAFQDFIDDSSEMTELMLNTLNKTIGILNRFKEISILQAQKDIVTFSLSERLRDIVDIYKERNHSIHYSLELPDDFIVKAPRGLIQEIFEILIENTLVHGFQDYIVENPTILIHVENVDNDLVIIFADNGQGIETHQKKRVFEPFYTTKFGSGGSGLGLHLLYNIISTALQGRIDITERDGFSLAFKITLPGLLNKDNG